MKAVAGLIFLFAVVSANSYCENKRPSIPSDWTDMVNPCTQKMADNVRGQLSSALKHLAMAAHSTPDTMNLSGFAELFKSVSEEREQAMKFIGYLVIGSGMSTKVRDIINTAILPHIKEWDNGISALRNALELQPSVTKNVRDIIASCGSNEMMFNNYHLLDYLTGEFLGEQYHQEGDLAGKISALFDKKFLG